MLGGKVYLQNLDSGQIKNPDFHNFCWLIFRFGGNLIFKSYALRSVEWNIGVIRWEYLRIERRLELRSIFSMKMDVENINFMLRSIVKPEDWYGFKEVKADFFQRNSKYSVYLLKWKSAVPLNPPAGTLKWISSESEKF